MSEPDTLCEACSTMQMFESDGVLCAIPVPDGVSRAVTQHVLDMLMKMDGREIKRQIARGVAVNFLCRSIHAPIEGAPALSAPHAWAMCTRHGVVLSAYWSVFREEDWHKLIEVRGRHIGPASISCVDAGLLLDALDAR